MKLTAILHVVVGALAPVVMLPVAYGESLLRDTSVQADRFVDAPVVTKLPAGTAVQLLKSEAGWSQIKAGDVNGWVRASAIDGAGAKVANTAQMQSGRTAGNNIMSTSGIRGPQTAEAPTVSIEQK